MDQPYIETYRYVTPDARRLIGLLFCVCLEFLQQKARMCSIFCQCLGSWMMFKTHKIKDCELFPIFLALEWSFLKKKIKLYI